jgi:hypothetical protein
MLLPNVIVESATELRRVDIKLCGRMVVTWNRVSKQPYETSSGNHEITIASMKQRIVSNF